MHQFLALDRWERSHSQILIQTRFMSAWASPRFEAIPRMATEFTNQLTLVRHGNALDWKTPGRSLAFGFIQKTRTSSTLLRKVTCGGRTKPEVSIVQKMAARPGKEFCTKATKLVRATWLWIQRTQVFFTPDSGRCIENPGRSKAADPRVASSNQLMVVIHGLTSRVIQVCPKERSAL